ncbi:hypothetical protein D3C80_1798580 [compost metagenome]
MNRRAVLGLQISQGLFGGALAGAIGIVQFSLARRGIQHRNRAPARLDGPAQFDGQVGVADLKLFGILRTVDTRQVEYEIDVADLACERLQRMLPRERHHLDVLALAQVHQ